jgi:recombination protein RecR
MTMGTNSAYPVALQALTSSLRRLPGIGARTAERLALALLSWPEEQLREFAAQLASLRERVRFCRVCGNLADADLCRICTDPSRQASVICVVEQPTQIATIERTGCYRGLYHVLGGRIVPLDGKGPEDLRLAELRQRLDAGGVQELIVATSLDVEGEATATYLAWEFSPCGVRITRIAAGVPVGADLSFADAATMAMALNGRRPLSPGRSEKPQG